MVSTGTGREYGKPPTPAGRPPTVSPRRGKVQRPPTGNGVGILQVALLAVPRLYIAELRDYIPEFWPAECMPSEPDQAAAFFSQLKGSTQMSMLLIS